MNSRFIRGLKWQFIANLAQGLFGGVYLIALGKFLGAQSFGVYSLGTSLSNVLFLMIELRMQEVVIRFVCPEDPSFDAKTDRRWLSDLFCLDVALRIAVSGIIALIVLGFGQLKALEAVPIDIFALCMAAHFLNKAGNSVAVGLLRALNRFDVVAGVLAGEWFLKLLTLVLLARFWTLDITSAIVVAGVIGFFSNLLLLSIAVGVWVKAYAFFPSFEFKGITHRLMSAKRYIFTNLGVSLSDLLVKDLDVVITGAFVSTESVGIYKMTKNIVQVLWRVVDPFYMVVMPELRKMHSSGTPETKATFIGKIMKLLAGAGIFLYLSTWAALAIGGTWILSGDFAPVISLFPYMGLWVVICAPLIWGPPLAIASGHPELSLIGGVSGNALGLLLFIPLASSFGIPGAGIAWSLSLIFVFVITAFLCQRKGLLVRSPS